MDHHPLTLALSYLGKDDEPMQVVLTFVNKYYHHKFRIQDNTGSTDKCAKQLSLSTDVYGNLTVEQHLREHKHRKYRLVCYAIEHGYDSLFFWALENHAPVNDKAFWLAIARARPLAIVQALDKARCRWHFRVDDMAVYPHFKWILDTLLANKNDKRRWWHNDMLELQLILHSAVAADATKTLQLLVRAKVTDYREVCDLSIEKKRILVFEWVMQCTHGAFHWSHILTLAGEEYGIDWLDIAYRLCDRKRRSDYHRLSNFAAENGLLHILKWSREVCRPPIPWGDQVMKLALDGDHRSIVEYALRNGCPLGNLTDNELRIATKIGRTFMIDLSGYEQLESRLVYPAQICGNHLGLGEERTTHFHYDGDMRQDPYEIVIDLPSINARFRYTVSKRSIYNYNFLQITSSPNEHRFGTTKNGTCHMSICCSNHGRCSGNPIGRMCSIYTIQIATNQLSRDSVLRLGHHICLVSIPLQE